MISEKRKEYLKKYRLTNKEYLKEYSKKYNQIYYQNNKKGIKQKISIRGEKHYTGNNKTERRCSKCKLIKQISLFSKNRTKPLGYDYQCAVCVKKFKIWKKKDTKSIKVLARRKLSKAVFLGKIKKEPCVVCGNPKVEGHHEDYLKPLEVIWLCTEHHIEHHVKLRKLSA